jgi:putative membrane protein
MKRASRLTILALPAAAALVLPTMAWGAGSGTANTLRATIGGDGSVKSVSSLAGNGTSSPYSGDLPLKLSISRSVQGGTSTYAYHVENTYSKTQNVSYTDTQGVTHSASATVQLPLVAQLGVTVPKSFTNVSAPSAVVTTDPDGTNRILWNLVLFSPLGSPTQDLAFTASGQGVPTSELVATPVNPATTAGLSQAQQDATAASQQDDFWQGYANGGNGGLTQLASGTTAMIAGLKKLSAGAHTLNAGLKTAQAGANKLDAGTKSAYTGSVALSSGVSKIHAGQAKLTDGLKTIDGFLKQYADSTNGLPAAAAGAHGVMDGVDALKTLYVGTDAGSDPANWTGLLGGVAKIKGGLLLLQSGVQASASCTATILTALISAAHAAGDAQPCLVSTGGQYPFATTQITGNTATLLGGVAASFTAVATDAGDASPATPLTPLDTFNPGITALLGGLAQVRFGLTHPAGTLGAGDPGGALELLSLLSTGLHSKLVPGLDAAAAGAGPLATGADSALAGSAALRDGSSDAAAGATKLASGLGQLSTGQHQVVTGLPAAVGGSDQIAGGIDQVLDGANKVEGGIVAVQTGAVGPLTTQLLQGSQNQKKQVAIVEAAAALAAQAPGGAGTSYVLTQFNPKLAAATTSVKSGSSHTGRNVGIGLGGFAALVIAVVAGFALGRRSPVATTAG